MSSVPDPSSHLSPSSTPMSIRRSHRHRRSAAISGDFDIMGLGLFSPSNDHNNSPGMVRTNNTNTNNNDDDELDKHFNFNNDDDFTNKPAADDFNFPNKTPDLSSISTPPRYFPSANARKNAAYNLNSPIKLNHRRTLSSNNATSKSRFFLTEETNFNNENVPNAVIDLDEILNANLHIGNDLNNNTGYNHKKTELLPHDIFGSGDDDFFTSPNFLKQSSFSSSPLSVPNNITLFQQPIQEQTSDSIAEEEHDEEEIEDEEENIDMLASDNEGDLFTNPKDSLGVIYTNLSANSSSSSLKSAGNQLPSGQSKYAANHFIEKTMSNSSKESSNSGNYNSSMNFNYHPSSTPISKRSGAKANRYQSFYDQSFRITNALKFSSSESINIERSNSGGQNSSPNAAIPGNGNIIIPAKILGHSSSLPSLKSNLKRIIPPHQTQRLSDLRYKQDLRKTASPSPSNSPRFSSPQIISSDLDNSINTINLNKSNSASPIPRESSPSIIATPPVLYVSETPSLPEPTNNEVLTPTNKSNSNAVTHPKEYSNETTGSKPPLKSNSLTLTIDTKNITNSPISVSSEISSTGISSLTDHSSLISQSDHNSGLKSKSTPILEQHPSLDTPLIVIAKDADLSSSSSTNSTFHQGDEDNDSQTVPKTPKDTHASESESEFKTPLINSSASLPLIDDPSSPNGFPLSIPIVSTPPTNSYSTNSFSSTLSSLRASPRKKSSRRPLSPSEEKILIQTAIPVFRPKEPAKPNVYSQERAPLDSSIQTPTRNSTTNGNSTSKYRHSKSKSMSLVMLDITPGLSNTSNDNPKLTKNKNNRIISWFKKKR